MLKLISETVRQLVFTLKVIVLKNLLVNAHTIKVDCRSEGVVRISLSGSKYIYNLFI